MLAIRRQHLPDFDYLATSAFAVTLPGHEFGLDEPAIYQPLPNFGTTFA
jgi:hypothetical protein